MMPRIGKPIMWSPSSLLVGLVPALLWTGALSACGDKPTPIPQPNPLPVVTQAPASAAPIASASAEPSASASSSALAIPSVIAPQGPVKWADFGGPEVKSPVKDAQHAWAVLPVSSGWDTLKFSLHDATRVEDTQVIFNISGVDYYVPAAFVISADAPKDLATGDAVIASAYETRVFGRVTAMGPKVKVKYRFATSIEEKEFEPHELLKLDGTLHFGAPVLFKEEREGLASRDAKLRPGHFISSDEGKTWLLAFAGKPQRVSAASVQPMDVKQRKVGDKVWVTRQDEVVSGLVAEVQEDGVRYRVKLESGDESTATLDAITSPLAGMTPPPTPATSASAGPPPR